MLQMCWIPATPVLESNTFNKRTAHLLTLQMTITVIKWITQTQDQIVRLLIGSLVLWQISTPKANVKWISWILRI
jgi:uncharacterized membrane protein